jgi:hypothetical protein
LFGKILLEKLGNLQTVKRKSASYVLRNPQGPGGSFSVVISCSADRKIRQKPTLHHPREIIYNKYDIQKQHYNSYVGMEYFLRTFKLGFPFEQGMKIRALEMGGGGDLYQTKFTAADPSLQAGISLM